MKRTIFIICFVILAFSCNTSEYNLENLIPDRFKRVVCIKGERTADWNLFDVGIELSTDMTVLRSGGIPDLEASVKLVSMTQEELTSFGAGYVLVDPSYYSVPASVAFAPGERYKSISLSVPYDRIRQLKAQQATLADGQVYCIALKLIQDGETSVDPDACYMLRRVTVTDPKIEFGLFPGEQWHSGDSMNIKVSLPFENKDFKVEWKAEFESDSFLALNDLGESTERGNSLPAKYNVRPLPLSAIRNAEVNSMEPGSNEVVYTVKLPQDASYGNYYFKVKLSNPTLNGTPIGSLYGDVEASIRFQYMPPVNMTNASGAYTALADYATVVPPASITFVPESSDQGSFVNALDNDTGTIWENNWGQAGSYGITYIPFNAAVDLGAPTQVDLLEIWRRSGNFVTDLRRFEVYAAEVMDYSNKTSIAYTGLTYLGEVDFGGPSNKNQAQLFALDATTARYFLLRFTHSNRGGSCISIAEMGWWHK